MNTSAYRFFLGFALLGALLVGCGGGGGSSTSSTLSDQEVIQKATPAVVQITTATGDQKFGGSGVLYSTDQGARVLTNAHVISGANAISVNVSGQKYTARVVGQAPCEDVAVLEIINPPTDLTTMPLGSSAAVQSGDDVVAMGFPTNAQRNASATVTSTTGQVTNADIVGNQVSAALPEYPSLIETSATVNPGNSGGPLLNNEGEVIGINTLSSAGSNEVEGQYYAISIDHIKAILPGLEAGTDQVNVGWNLVPLQLTPLTELASDLVAQYGVSAKFAVNLAKNLINSDIDGLYNLGSQPGSPAEKAKPEGIIQGDLVTDINGTNVKTIPQVCRILESASPGQTLRVGGTIVASGASPSNFADTFEDDISIPAEQAAMTTTSASSTAATSSSSTTSSTTSSSTSTDTAP